MAVFSPVQDTWARAVNQGYFDTWPGIKSKYINRMPKAEVIIRVHLIQIRKHTQSNITNRNSADKHTITDPIQEQNNVKTELFMTTL